MADPGRDDDCLGEAGRNERAEGGLLRSLTL